jgi:polyhydroxyalkanoate synthesis repressor PhaR
MPLIKRYANRKLYDTESKRYITLDGIAELIRQAQDVKVIDHETGEDITALTQAQIIFEQERKLRGGIPRTVFTNLIQTSSDTLSQVWHALIPPDELKKAVDTEIEHRVQGLIQSGRLTDDQGLQMLDVLLPTQEAAPPPKPERVAPLGGLERLIKPKIPPTQDQLEQLTKQVEALTAEVERLTKSAAQRIKPPNNKKP